MTPLAIITAVFNSLWQSAALAALVRPMLKRARFNAATRGTVWWLVLLMTLALPLAPSLAARWRRTPFTAATSQVGDVGNLSPASRSYVLPPAAGEQPAIVTLTEKPAAVWPFAIAALWALVLLNRIARIAQSYARIRELKRNASVSDLPLPGTGRRARLLVSREIASPMAVGFPDPAVIVPQDLIARISREELDQILLHESAHLARRDDWSNLLGRLLGAVLALHPVAWWILRQIEFEREAACDDWAVARTGAVMRYAETLAHVVELQWESRGVPLNGVRPGEEALASGVFGQSSRIGDRIEMLLQRGRQFSPRVSMTRVAAVCFALCCLAAAGSVAPRWIAFAKTSAPNRAVVPVAVAGPVPPMAPVVRNSPGPALVAQAEPAAPFVRQVPPATAVTSVRATAGTTPSDWIRPKVEDAKRFHARTTAQQLIQWAYDVREFQVLQMPDWIRQQQFDVQAVSEAPLNEPGFRRVLQGVLADRFGLKVHRETRELAVYDLVAGKNGPKLKFSDADEIYCCDGEINVGRGQFIAEGATMPLFVRILTDNLDRPVLDKTGLDGHYDFAMNYEPGDGPGWTPIGAQLLTLVQYLGLRLEPQKASIEILVIDSVARPSEN